MAKVLIVSKPVAPPWNDSSKNLVRDLCLGSRDHALTVMGRKGGASVEGAKVERVYPESAGGFSPALADNARVLKRLLVGTKHDVWHFFFAPNTKSALAGAFSRSVRRVPTLQTVCSAPAEGADLSKVLFTDRVVVLSAHTEARFLREGVSRERVVRIPPAVATFEAPTATARAEAREHFRLPNDAALVVYAGDLEFGSGARNTLDAVAQHSEVHLAMACRTKTERAKEAERELRARVAGELEKRVHWIGETDRILDLLACADVVALPSETLHAKMDYPLVILEAMALGRPVIVGRGTPAEELACESAFVVGREIDDLSHAIGQALEASGDTARVRVAEFSVSAMAEQYGALYRALT